jgi:membrane-associated protease RseP (regulator of RpoE activity)
LHKSIRCAVLDLPPAAIIYSAGSLEKVPRLVATLFSDSSATLPQNPQSAWRVKPVPPYYYNSVPRHPPFKTLLIAIALFFLTLCTCMVAGTHFAAAYAQNQAVSWDEFIHALTLLYRQPFALAGGLPFALTLLAILLTHELGHFFACRHHRIHSSYPFFIPFPTLIGTLGAFILIRSPIRTTRALFDVGASGPLVGFVVAVPALVYGILHAKFVPGLSDPAHTGIVLGTPLILRLLAALFHPGISASNLLLHPVGRAAWVGLFATSLNLLPAAQLDGGHILRSLSARAHRYSSIFLPVILVCLALFHFWAGWYVWGALLLVIRFFRFLPIYDPVPLDNRRRFAAALTLLIFILCFMPAPFIELIR